MVMAAYRVYSPPLVLLRPCPCKAATIKASLFSKFTSHIISSNTIKPKLLTNLLSLALTISLNSTLPSLAIPSLNNSQQSLSPTTPFAESQFLQLGLENGVVSLASQFYWVTFTIFKVQFFIFLCRKIRPCPSTNPGCVSTNPKSFSFAFPLTIPGTLNKNPIEKLQEAILKTQKNAKIQVVEDTPNGQYLQAEVDGGFGSRDVLEFLVRGDVVAYRSMAAKVTYIYPFTTAIGDSKGQEERMKKIIEELDWYAPNFDSMD